VKAKSLAKIRVRFRNHNDKTASAELRILRPGWIVKSLSFPALEALGDGAAEKCVSFIDLPNRRSQNVRGSLFEQKSRGA